MHFKILFIWLHWVLLVARGILKSSLQLVEYSSLTGIKPEPPALIEWSHWTTGEAPMRFSI